MTRNEIREKIEGFGIYFDPDHPDHISRDKIDTLEPPFLEWGTQKRSIRADGIDYIIIASNNGYTGTLNFVKISDQFRQDCLAETVDITTGIQYEDADATPDPFALMGEFKGDTEGIRFIYYNCTASRPNQTGENKDNMREPDTESLSLQASPLPCVIDGTEKNIVRGGVTKSANAATYNQWFSKVCLPGISNA